MSSTFDLLMEFPLLMGVSREKLAKVIGDIKLHFLKYQKSEKFIEIGQKCDDLTLLLSGTALFQVYGPDGFLLTYTMTGPVAVGANYLFGLQPKYPFTAIAATDISVLRIPKADYIKLLNQDKVFLFSYLNSLALGSQNTQSVYSRFALGSLRDKFRWIVESIVPREAVNISIRADESILCKYFNVDPAALQNEISLLVQDGIAGRVSNMLRLFNRDF